MTTHHAGDSVTYTVTFLEMTERPRYDWPHTPNGMTGALLKAETPPVWYFRALYDAVGRDYAWTDLHTSEDSEIADWLKDKDVALYSLIDHGWPQGFFLLDWRTPRSCELCYFGLVPPSVGRGLGSWMLRTAILTAWAREGVEVLHVNTCTLDHPRALIQYQKHGFTPVRQEQRARVLTRAWTPQPN
ncbi:acetyltransferase (GNAT) family protein [Roseinatronobacter thiooxidans]|uniref:Acetyltransferase (GNAT) family protein n=1 Tax=Roseinatronobacter thiooxidans TaxID=121821 RepID=A0A2W7PPN8_9RHOB|nr:GNAT family N-acetyltransferase [Roseinatronobacter thiooxidans]PZX38058.1 acetyltransferase (GNAT) family protein [Roseinatronobacter thiooxidans]